MVSLKKESGRDAGEDRSDGPDRPVKGLTTTNLRLRSKNVTGRQPQDELSVNCAENGGLARPVVAHCPAGSYQWAVSGGVVLLAQPPA
jgi:hypothetical protein